jgi:ribosome-binding factor A
LRFRIDRTHERAARISELLAEVKTSEEHDDGEDTN